ncbi:hypothetical protein ACQUY5_31440 [Bacillus cereus]|uniref:hypothetical protein n=1 Tax=Bacillus cereus TaxID=1396 RepID=UPI003D186E06
MSKVKECKIDGCREIAKARGLCQKHYARLLRTGSTELKNEVIIVKDKPCTIEGCKNKQKAKGLCRYHYMLNWKESKTSRCKINGCMNKEFTTGLCEHHYRHQWEGKLEETGV